MDEIYSLDANYAASELRYNAFMAPAYRSAVGALALTPGAHLLDAGCGPGGVWSFLTETVGANGRITGIDGSQTHLDAAQRFAQEQGIQTALRLHQADLRRPLQFADSTFDCAWCADVLWPSRFPDPVVIVAELARVVKPGGTVAIFFGNLFRGTTLPGYPRLEWLTTTAADRRWRSEASLESAGELGNGYERPLGWLQQAGLQDCVVTNHPILYQQPLPSVVRAYLQEYLFAEEFGPAVAQFGTAVGLTDAERALFIRLTTPGAPEYLLDQVDYYCSYAPVLARGVVNRWKPTM